ncbi:Fur family transcriptional regulator [Gluconacetobacter sacchari]|uniref:Fur family transcriptional regulator n=2 Tax=Gluconacetobacter sacchari TaxID=92759 RepID=A0A7W4IFE6_9PROT|nr:Fur family transcriptional regulator [Gluconacetobacter sacchari]MBB2161843.1 Fur family transcriptional regulator [Gluconacetobacter sacchari]GBQ19365.1 Fur family transcriptional regulator [Gluconacetobacter sacchari DSM 12717]
MLAFPEHRRSPPDVRQIRPGMGASARLVRQLERRCFSAGLKMTDLRRVLLHGILEAGDGATALEIWKNLTGMVDGYVPSHGSLQRNLNLMVELGVLRRDVGADRVWRYGLPPDALRTTGDMPIVRILEAGTGRRSPCDLPEVATFLRRLAVERGLDIRSAAITVRPVPKAPV